jgi:hypothetical protein
LKVPERRVGRTGVYVVQDQMALAEGTAFGVLPDHPDRRAFRQERAQGQRLGVRPFDPPRGVQRLLAAPQQPLELGMGGESGRPLQKLLIEALKPVLRHGGDRFPYRHPIPHLFRQCQIILVRHLL